MYERSRITQFYILQHDILYDTAHETSDVPHVGNIYGDNAAWSMDTYKTLTRKDLPYLSK